MTHMLNLNPTAKTVAGAGMFSDLIYPKRDGSSGSSASAQEHLPPAQQVVSALSQDPAYSVVQKEMPYLNVLHKLLTSGNNGGVNWDEATLSADYVLQMLQDAAHNFNDVSSSDGQPSKNLKSILATTSEISGTLVPEAKKGVAMGNKFPQADSADVKGWQARVQESYKQAQQMTAFARALPGGSPVGSTLMAIPLDPNEVIAKSNVKSAQAQATPDAIKNRLLTAQDCYIKTKMLYNNSIKLATAQKENLIATQTQLKRLNEKNAGIEEIKTLLESCINVTIEVKTQIMNLVILLRSVSATIEEVTKFIAAPFIKQIQAIETRGDQTKTIGPFSLIDLQRSLVYSSATMICSHYSVVGDIAAMWARLSGNDMQPGFQLLDEIFSTKNDLSNRQACQTLLTWADKAIGDIQNFAEEFNRKISDDMTTQNTEMAKMINQFKVPKTPEIVNAIQAGTDEVLNAATVTITANADARPLDRSAPIKV
ncbi:hypothetical protein PFICI_11893 [Pestalotiopsis fici W106-1]|uniref:Uncharacterized protein n=1 Tax=Pestalotiopsis fici (strain W106-1 / CGMCC3.15140) TaxID=1229662 RepID=W3WUG3_PESFW|nr:uncharacterized protein PFICI_11893 [Pestalotiopsis fici W106-1]ETS76506.1 hypothetical protein PFICI_11893 [Pestalotiopsis fici W106-1]